MTNKQRGIWLILGPILLFIIVGLLEFITRKITHEFFLQNNIISFVKFIVDDIFMIVGFILVLIFIPSIIAGIVFINKKSDDGKIWWIFQKKILMSVVGLIILLGVSVDVGMNCYTKQDIVCNTEKCYSKKYVICEKWYVHQMGGGTYESFLPIRIKNRGEFITNGNINILKGDSVEIGIIITNDKFMRIDWGDGNTEKSNEHIYSNPGEYTIQAGRYMGVIDGANIVQYAKVIVSEVK